MGVGTVDQPIGMETVPVAVALFENVSGPLMASRPHVPGRHLAVRFDATLLDLFLGDIRTPKVNRKSKTGCIDDHLISGGQGRELGECTASSTTQCRSNPVSGRCLPKTGIFQISTRDYRRFRSQIVEIGSLETAHQSAKDRNWWVFLRFT
jgi:hypothetical protein